MICPCCASAKLIRDTKDMSYTYQQERITISAVKGDFCPACGEALLDRKEGDRYARLIKKFRVEVSNRLRS